jgi:hypothetical protein
MLDKHCEKWRAKCFASGLCVQCGKRPPADKITRAGKWAGKPSRRCQSCLDTHQRRQRTRRAANKLREASEAHDLFAKEGGADLLRLIAGRLRKEPWNDKLRLIAAAVLSDAADEIERLTADNNNLLSAVDSSVPSVV